MKKFIGIIVLVLIFLCSATCENDADIVRRAANNQSTQAQLAAQAAVTVPDLSYFQERRTIAKWAEHWDKPDAACYVYLISYGNIIGYYVSSGKPAATASYLTPEYRYEYYNGSAHEVQLPDIDGCYGLNNPGIRFFTASGIAVEWGGATASYLYSDVPLNLNVPLLGN